jgi:Cd2+/Zn2+-exporting ATPase
MVSESAVLLRYRVDGMDCSSCVAKIENALAPVEGVSELHASAVSQTLTLRLERGALRQDVERRVDALGYRLRRLEALDADSPSDHAPWWQSRKVLLTSAYGAALAAAWAGGRMFPQTAQWFFLAALAIGLIPIARRAVYAALAGTPFSIEMLMTIAAAGAAIIGATEEAATVVFLFLVGELLEGVAAGRARAGIRSLTGLVPKIAHVEREGKTREIPAEQLNINDVILVRPGDRIPADGAIIEGQSAVDESPVTGESIPIAKGTDDVVLAGTINGDGVLRVRVSAASSDNTIARVIKLVEQAQESKSPTQRFIDRFSRYYTPAVVAVAVLVAVLPPLLTGALWGEWVYKGLAVLLIGCPCALVISTPAAIAAGLSAGARRGLLMKGGVVLENLGRITVAAFDKTGTLTEGRPQITDLIEVGRTEKEILSFAGSLAAGSSHPLSIAILARAKAKRVPLPPAANPLAVPGKGVSGSVGGVSLFLGSPQAASEMAQIEPKERDRISKLNEDGKTVSVLIAGNSVAGIVALRDEPRTDAKAGIEALARLGIRSIMVTGDNRRAAASIAARLGLEPNAELLPEDKQQIVLALQAKGEKVAKIGDGINDAPGLAAADVGIAMGGGTDVALETADAAVLHGRVMDVASMVSLSRKVMANIHQNIAVALGLKAVFLVTTIIGVTGLWPAILADTGATVLVTMNALRLLGARQLKLG